MNQEQQIDRFARLLERSGTDLAFRSQLLADPRGTLQAAGVTIPSGTELIALENTDSVVNLVIPAAPDEGELSDVQLEDVTGGFGLGIALGILAASFVVGGAAAGGAGIGAGFGIGKRLLKSR